MWLCEKPLLRLEVPCREEGGRGDERREQEMWGRGEVEERRRGEEKT